MIVYQHLNLSPYYDELIDKQTLGSLRIFCNNWSRNGPIINETKGTTGNSSTDH